MDKQQLKADLIAHLRGGVLTEMAEANAEGAAALVDERELTDEQRVDDLSQEDEAGELHGLAREAEEQESEEVAAATALDMSATDVVRPGAVVELDGERFVVGVASSEFESGGQTYSGISTDAPVYAELVGKRAGDTVTMGDGEVQIGSVG